MVDYQLQPRTCEHVYVITNKLLDRNENRNIHKHLWCEQMPALFFLLSQQQYLLILS